MLIIAVDVVVVSTVDIYFCFITAPTHPTPIVPEPIQDEHKTLVYVFVKNPNTESPSNAQETSTESSKPEVFFVKYKENDESEKQSPE